MINMSSMMGSIADNTIEGLPLPSYRCSKSALNQLNKTFAVHHPEATFIAMHPGNQSILYLWC